MKTQKLHLKVLFLSLLFFFIPFIYGNSGGEPQNHQSLPELVQCSACEFLQKLPEDSDGGFYCKSCGRWNLGTVIIVPPGYYYCYVCKRAIPLGPDGYPTCKH